jgi:hypothetical protein
LNFTLGLNMYSSNCCLFDPIDLKEKETCRLIEENKYHIYLICKRKKMHLDKWEVDDNGDTLVTLYYLDDTHNKKYIGYRNKDIRIKKYKDGFYYVTYKGKDLEIRDFVLINNFCYIDNDFMGNETLGSLPSDLEVMYIGQAFGRNTNRTIDYRLKNHEKIQEIALDILSKATNEEVLSIGVAVKENDLSMIIAHGGNIVSPPTKNDLYDLYDSAKKRPSEGQKITLFEASLISYFQPKLNTEYKKSFPAPDFKSYDEIYDMDFDFISFALTTGETVFCRLFSEKITNRLYIHHGKYWLHSNDQDKSLIDFVLERSSV